MLNLEHFSINRIEDGRSENHIFYVALEKALHRDLFTVAVNIGDAWGKANAALLGRLPRHRYKQALETALGLCRTPISVHKTEGPSDIPVTSAGMTPDIIPTPFHVGRNVAHHLMKVRSEALIESNHVVHFPHCGGQIYHSPEKGPPWIHTVCMLQLAH